MIFIFCIQCSIEFILLLHEIRFVNCRVGAQLLFLVFELSNLLRENVLMLFLRQSLVGTDLQRIFQTIIFLDGLLDNLS